MRPLFADYVGNPCIVALDRDRCVVADGTGQVVLIDLPAQEIRARVYVGIMGGRSGLQPPLVAPASGAAGDRGGRHPGRLCGGRRGRPPAGGEDPSRAGGHGPGGRLLAGRAIPGDRHGLLLPLGRAPAGARRALVLSDEEPPDYAGFAALPGVCVDAIDLERRRRPARLRIRPAVAEIRLHRPTRGRGSPARSFFETPWTGAGRPCYVDRESPGSHLAVAFKGGFRLLVRATASRPGRPIGPRPPICPWTSTSTR